MDFDAPRATGDDGLDTWGTMDLAALRALIAVVDTGSLRAAAAATGLPRSTLRRRLHELDASVGAPLLVSTENSWVLTDVGAELLAGGRALVSAADELLYTARERGERPYGELRVRQPPGLPAPLVAAGIQVLLDRWAELSLLIRVGDEPDSAALEHGEALLTWQTPPAGAWTVVELFHVPVRLQATKAYLTRFGAPADPDEVLEHPLIMWRPTPDTRRELRRPGAEPVRVQPRVFSSDLGLLVNLARAGRWLAYMPYDSRQMMPQAPALTPILADTVGETRVLRLVVPDALLQLPRVQAIVENMRSFALSLA